MRGTFPRLLALSLLAITAHAATTGIVAPAFRGVPNTVTEVPDLDTTVTDAQTIETTVNAVTQKSGAPSDVEPNLPVPETVVTALDGELVNATVSDTTGGVTVASTSSGGDVQRRLVDGYEQVFSGTGTRSTDRDGSIEGTAYLTYTVVSNATYDVDACLSFCNRVDGCVFANLYYEYNNYLLDYVFGEHSNLKCALYGDIHSAAEKTNRGGQQLIEPPAGLTYIQESSGWASGTLADPADPEGYELVFGPTGGANNAPGYMGFAFIDKYDVNACAALCNTRGSDGRGGACQYFNIWRAVVNGNPTTYTCSFYYIVADESTAVNTGQGDLKVTYSRGYKRKSLLVDGTFEGFGCANNDEFCFAGSYANWIGVSPDGGTLDASIFHFAPYAHTGNGVGLLGSASGLDNLSGTLTLPHPLPTKAGKTYKIAFFHNSLYAGEAAESSAFVEILWNGNVLARIMPGFEDWTFREFLADASGSDTLAFRGGRAPAWSFIDDIYVFEM